MTYGKCLLTKCQILGDGLLLGEGDARGIPVAQAPGKRGNPLIRLSSGTRGEPPKDSGPQQHGERNTAQQQQSRCGSSPDEQQR